jgi:hypothetical protein
LDAGGQTKSLRPNKDAHQPRENVVPQNKIVCLCTRADDIRPYKETVKKTSFLRKPNTCSILPVNAKILVGADIIRPHSRKKETLLFEKSLSCL